MLVKSDVLVTKQTSTKRQEGAVVNTSQEEVQYGRERRMVLTNGQSHAKCATLIMMMMMMINLK